MQTPKYLNVLISYKELFGTDGTQEEAKQLIAGINSATILYKFAHINLYMYLAQPGPEGKALQLKMLKSFLSFTNIEFSQRFLVAINQVEADGQWPAVFWEHSTLLFFDLIFENFVDGPVQRLSEIETENILKAYLIINSITNNRFTVTQEEIQSAVELDKLEDIFLPHFIYQRDYESNLDFSNQLNRGVELFKYLESSTVYRPYVQGYYNSLQVKDYKDLFYNTLTVWAQAEIDGPVGDRRAQISFSQLLPLTNIAFIDTLAINGQLQNYKSDKSFTAIRQQPLFKIGPTEYLILDINFLNDKLYKGQLFSFNTFLKTNGYRGNFLSVKGKEFMEDIYFRALMLRCFPTFKNLNGDEAVKIDGGELCDHYARKVNKVLLIEFKDVLLNADIKENADSAAIDLELNKKFMANQSNSPKGITQLYNAVKYLETTDVVNDSLDRTSKTDIYPVIVYTDRSFGHDGINKKFRLEFRKLLEQDTWVNLHINDVCFVNLNYFEVHEQYLAGELIDIFKLFDEFGKYVDQPDNSLTRFEVFSRAYFEENDLPDIKDNPIFASNVAAIMPQPNPEN
ncbi:hypothetical protein GCM10027037_05770 [Mucilaginibacter koreensis]